MIKLEQMSLENDGDGENGNGGRRRIHLREISGDSDHPLETIGQDLRAARLRRGDEIAAVSRALKIRKDHLEALEENRPDDLPGRTYALGFVRSYAQYLGLDAARFAERYKQEVAGRTEEAQRPPAPIHQDDQGRLPQGWRIIGIVVLGLLGYGAWHLFFLRNDSTPPVPPAPVLVQSRPAAPAPKPVVVPEQSAIPSPALDTTTPPGPQAAAQAPAGQTAMPPPAAGPQTPATQFSAAIPPGKGNVYGQQNENPRVVLRATADTRITVKGADGTLYINRDLKAGDTYRVPNMVGLNLATSNGGAVEIDLDGQPMGKAGQSQQVLGRVSLEAQSLADRFKR